MTIESLDDEGRAVALPSRRRLLLFAVVLVASAAAALGYALHAAWRARVAAQASDAPAVVALAELPAATPGSSAARPYLLFRSSALDETHGRVSLQYLDEAGSQRGVTPLLCERVHFAAGRGICLQAKRGVLTTYHALIFDRHLQTLHSVALAGAPSRARMSADGKLAAMTVFVTGHSYMSANFSTRTSIVDVRSGELLVDDLEKLEVVRDGQPFKAADFNFWGVTFAGGSGRFHATLATGGRIFLVEGDLAARRMRVVHDDVECPSLSPDGKRIAFKRRVPAEAGRLVWRLHVLELATGKVTPLLAETRNVDDQVEWLGDAEVVYALAEDRPGGTAATDTWALAADGTRPPRLLARLAFSPAVVR
jgi:hypothetical protein